MRDRRLNQLIERANKRARRTGKPVYVVWDPCDGQYHLATEWDLDTYFTGLLDEHILYCAMPA